MKWFENQQNVQLLAEALYEAGHITTIRSLLYFYSKPWKWELEWRWLQQHENLHEFVGEVEV